MARPEGELPATNDPITQLARELRRLRQRAGNISYREMARSANFSPSVLAAAAAGRTLPTLSVVKAFTAACGEDQSIWEARWYRVRAQLGKAPFPMAPSEPVVPSSTHLAPAHPLCAPDDPVPAQVPPDVADFTGRRAELDYLVGRLTASETGDSHERTDNSVLALVGAAGIGKTVLAVRAAHKSRESYPDGQLFLTGRGQGEAEVEAHEALGRMLRALGVPASRIPESAEERSAMYRTRLANRRVLVVLDDVPDETFARLLLPPTSGCACIVTSRSTLLGLEGVDRLEIPEFGEAEALQFLTRLVGRERMAAEPEASAKIVSLCCGLPLALRISGARLASRAQWPLATWVKHLAGESTRLSELAAGDLTVRTSLLLSYQRLSQRSQVMFRRLGLMPNLHFGVAAAAAVVGDPIETARRDLEALTDASLLTSPAPERYRFHRIGQLFARECLTGSERSLAVGQAEDRLFSWYEQAARTAARTVGAALSAPDGDTQWAAFGRPEDAAEWLQTELTAVTKVVEQLAVGAHPERAVALVTDLSSFLRERKLWRAYRLLHEHALVAAHSIGDTASEAAMRQRLDVSDLEAPRSAGASRPVDAAA